MLLHRFSVAAVGSLLLASQSVAGPEKPVIPPARVAVNAQSEDQIVADIVKASREQWAAQGLSADLCDKLAGDLAIVLRSYLRDDFDSVDRLWTERGAKLGAWAAAWAEEELRPDRYDEADAARLKTAPAREQLKYLWSHSAERGAKWERIGSDRVLAGTKLMVTAGSRDWPPNGGMGMGSRWQSPADQKARAAWLEAKKPRPSDSGWVHVESRDEGATTPPAADHWVSLQNKAMEGDIPAAFVQFPVKMLKGGTILWRMSFVYDPDRAAWFPLDLFCSISEQGDARPVF